MLMLLDRLAGWWLDFRQSQLIKDDESLAEFRALKQEPNETSIEVIAPGVAILAEQCADLLKAYDADNYLEFQLLPRVDRKLRPVLVTVRWAGGMTPSEKAAKLAKRVSSLEDALRVYADTENWYHSFDAAGNAVFVWQGAGEPTFDAQFLIGD